jgi:putative hydrolase of the HAD superfamily
LNAVIVFDADNTLWDTNGVFRRAQLDLLDVFARAGLCADAESQLQVLRRIDREFADRIGSFEYDFRLLPAALACHYTLGLTITEAVEKIVSQTYQNGDPRLAAIVDESYRAFAKGLRKIPRLYPDARTVISSIRSSRSSENRIVTVIFSEGAPERLERVFEAHEIRGRGLFDEIIIGAKSREAFEAAKRAGLKHLSSEGEAHETLFIMVGDSLQRDIKFGNQTGYTTVYIPAGFLGREKPREPDEEPHYIVERLSELPPILRALGLTCS